MNARLALPLYEVFSLISGAALAWLWISGHPVWAMALPACSLAAGWVFSWWGRRAPPQDPVRAVRCFEGRLLIHLGGGALAAGVPALATVVLTVSEGASAREKLLPGVLALAVGGFFLAVGVKGRDPNRLIGLYVSKQFQRRYRRPKPGQPAEPGTIYFPAGSPGELLVHDERAQGLDGWTFKARQERARQLRALIGQQDSG